MTSHNTFVLRIYLQGHWHAPCSHDCFQLLYVFSKWTRQMREERKREREREGEEKEGEGGRENFLKPKLLIKWTKRGLFLVEWESESLFYFLLNMYVPRVKQKCLDKSVQRSCQQSNKATRVTSLAVATNNSTRLRSHWGETKISPSFRIPKQTRKIALPVPTTTTTTTTAPRPRTSKWLPPELFVLVDYLQR